MPPFREALLKRKLNVRGNKSSDNTSSPSEDDDAEGDASAPEELFVGEIRDDGASDSEGEPPADDSDHETEGVLFGDDVDSTLGDDPGTTSDQSSELTDSEDDESENEEDNESSSDTEGDVSGEESGLGHTHSGSSNEEEQPPVETRPKRKQRSKQSVQTKAVSEAQGSKDSIDALSKQIQDTNVTIKPVEQKDEYESGDTSDEEDRVNTRGAVPAWWYREYPHEGYDVAGRRLLRPRQRDAIDQFLKQCEDPEFWRTVRDPSTGQDVVLSKQDLELIARIRSGQVPNAQHNEYEPWTEWFTREVLATPVRAFPDHKRSFLPSRDEQRHVARLVHALKMGWAKTRKQLAEERRQKREKSFYNLWGSAGPSSEVPGQVTGSRAKPIPAPRRPPPSHAESYNPPPEYLLDAKELKEWNKLSETPWKRKYTFLPTRYPSLRAVPAYERFIRERFLRCLDLYLAPRAIKMRLTISPEHLVPALPSPRDLQPFPTAETLVFRGHEALVRSCGFDPSGQYIVSGGDDGTVRVWETSTGRCLRTIGVGEPVERVAWAPVGGLSLVAAAVGTRLLLLNPGERIGDRRIATRTDQLLERGPADNDTEPDARTAAVCSWAAPTAEEWALGVRAVVTHFRPLLTLAWHARSDYLCVTLREAAARAVVVHQLSRRRSQLPFAKHKGIVQTAIFHPHKPLLFVATQRAVRIYDLVKQELVRKLEPGAQWLSALAIHPGGDNLLVASYDRKVMWFDLELSARPYQSLRLHGGAVRTVAFHRRYPLFATAGDDPYAVVSHGMVYNDLLQNPLLVPLKQLWLREWGGERRGERSGERGGELCATELCWHPAQPWLLVGGADHTLRLYT